MMKQLLLFGMLLMPFLLMAQDEDARYMPGAVPVEEGKVVFTKEMTDTSLSQSQLFDKLLAWAEGRFTDEYNRVAYADKEKGEIAVAGMEKLIFANHALSLDTSEMSYHLIIETDGHTATIKITHITYRYDVNYTSKQQRLVAEEVITDKYALTRKNKLNRINGKFRKGTVDFVDMLFSEIDVLFGQGAPVATPTVVAQPAPVVTPVATPEPQPTPQAVVSASPAPTKEGYMLFEADKVPQALLMLLPDSPMRVTAGTTSTPVETQAIWKGISEMFGKSVATINMAQASPVYALINDKYTLAFIKKGETSPWMIIECNKQGETTEGTTKTLLGEITQIWIK